MIDGGDRMELRFGPAGIPLSCKGRTLKDGIEDVHALELGAMEIQLLRPHKPIEEDVDLIGEIAEELDVYLYAHAPYYMDFLGKEEYRQRSYENLMWAAETAEMLGARILVTHIGLYHDREPKEALEEAVKIVRKVRDQLKKRGFSVKLGVETSGRQMVFGSLEEVLTVVRRVSGVVPVLNIGNIFCRMDGRLNTKEDFEELIYAPVMKVTKSKDFYFHFSGVERRGKDKLRNTPIKKGELKFETFVDSLLEHDDGTATIISDSPLLEHDAYYMQLITERVRQRRALRKKGGQEKKGAKSAKK